MTTQLSGSLLSRFKQLRQWQNQQSLRPSNAREKETHNLDKHVGNDFAPQEGNQIYDNQLKILNDENLNISVDSGASYSDTDAEGDIDGIDVQRGFSLNPEFLKVQKNSPLTRALNGYSSSDTETSYQYKIENTAERIYDDNNQPLEFYDSDASFHETTESHQTDSYKVDCRNLPFDEKPVRGSSDYNFNTFEELIEKKLQDEKLHASTNTKNNTSSKPKHSFLKKRSGSMRYKSSKAYNDKCDEDQATRLQRATIQSQEKMSSKQYQNKIMDDGNPLKLVDNVLPRGIPSDGAAAAVDQINSVEQVEDNIDDDKDDCQSVTSSVVESSFQQMIEKYKGIDELEEVELEEFEQLEYQAALLLSQQQNSFSRDVTESLPSHSVDHHLKTQVWVESGQLSHRASNENLPYRLPSNNHEVNNFNSLDDTIKQNPADYNFDDENSWHSISSDTIRGDSFDWNSSSSDSSVVEMNTIKYIQPLTDITETTKNTNDKNVKNNKVLKENQPPAVVSSPGINEVSLVDSKIAELDCEIRKFREETAHLKVLQMEIEEERNKLSKDKQSFFTEIQRREEEFQKFKDEEMAKISREKRLFNRHQKAIASMPSKSDRSEIESLKNQLKTFEEDLKTKQSRWNLSSSRYQTRIKDLEEENFQSKEQLKILEQEIIMLKKQKQNTKQKRKHHRNPIRHSLDSKLNETPTKEENRHQDIIRTDSKEKLTTAEQNVKTIQNYHHTHHQRLSDFEDDTPDLLETSTSNNAPLKRASPNDRLSTTPNRDTHDHPDGKTEEVLPDGSRVVSFPNGTKKTISEDGQRIVVTFFNGDIKRLILPEETIMYYYAESKTSHTTYKDGTEIVEFPNGQVEKHYADGSKEITFPDKSVKHLCLNGDEKIFFPDGTVQLLNADGTRHITFPNGQTEIHTSSYKRREFPDGTVKTIYEDGRQETRYSNGRLRVKDSRGVVIIDTLKQ